MSGYPILATRKYNTNLANPPRGRLGQFLCTLSTCGIAYICAVPRAGCAASPLANGTVQYRGGNTTRSPGF